MKELARPNVWMFLLLTFGLSWLLLQVPGWFLPHNEFLPLIQALCFPWGPAIAAVIMRKWVFSSSVKGLGWNRKYYDYRWIALTVFGPLGVVAATLGLVFLLGNVFHVPGFGRIDVGGASMGELKAYLGGGYFHELLAPIVQGINGEFLSTLLILTGLMLLIGATLGLLIHIGPEMGFRGYLLRELQPLGFLGGNTVLGFITGAWQSMVVFWILPGWSDQFIPLFLSIMGFNLSLAFPAAWLSLKTRSVYASGTFISVLNQVSGLTMLFLWNSDPYLAGVNGLAGMIVLMTITGLILYFDKPFVDRYEYLVY